MPNRPTAGDNQTIFHVLNRGVDKRTIFLNNKDYFRFIHDLFEFNDSRPVINTSYRFKTDSTVIAKSHIERAPRNLLVEIMVFCLMPNHYHLMLRALQDGGITRFMRKLNMGYARYFNEKYKRSGALFEGRYKSVAVTSQAHFIHLPYYVHLNPLDLVTPEWRERKMKNLSKALSFLEQYRWSSHLDYTGQKNFPSITQRGFLLDFFGGNKKYRDNVIEWLRDLDLGTVREIMLE